MKEEESRRDLSRLVLILAGLFVAYWFLLVVSAAFEDDEVSTHNLGQSVADRPISTTASA